MSEPGGAPAPLHPLFLKLAGRTVVVVGAGGVAARKIADLVAAGARVRVVAPLAAQEIEELALAGKVEWIARSFRGADLDGAWLAFAATDDADTQRAVAAEAETRRIFLVAVDDPANASAYSAAVLRRDPFAIAISSSGHAPALTRLLREILESALPGDAWVEAAEALREEWRAKKTPMDERFGQLLRAYASRDKRG